LRLNLRRRVLTAYRVLARLTQRVIVVIGVIWGQNFKFSDSSRPACVDVALGALLRGGFSLTLMVVSEAAGAPVFGVVHSGDAGPTAAEP
jgi:hypothetical protein